MPKKKEIGFKFRNADLSNFDKRWWSLYSMSFYYSLSCTYKICCSKVCWIFSVEHMYSLFSFTFEAYLPWYAFKVDCIWKICSSFRVSSFSFFLSILSDHALKEVAKLAHTIDMFWKLIIIWKCMLHFGRDFFFKFCHLKVPLLTKEHSFLNLFVLLHLIAELFL